MQEIVLFMVLQYPDLQCRRVFEDNSGELRIGPPFVVKNLVKSVLPSAAIGAIISCELCRNFGVF